MDWMIVGAIAALITAIIIAWGLRLQRRDPGRKWPIIAVGLIAGLVAGLAMLQAIWLSGRYPHRQKAIDRITVLIGGGLMFLVAYGMYGPPFGVGTVIESGYIARPDAGYAITLPDDWAVEDIAGVDDIFGEPIEEGMEPELLAASDDREQVAMVVTITNDERISAGMVALGILAWVREDPGISDASFEPVELDTGRSFRIDVNLQPTVEVPLERPMAT